MEEDGDATEPSRTRRWFCRMACLCGDTEIEFRLLAVSEGEWDRERERDGVLRSLSGEVLGEQAKD